MVGGRVVAAGAVAVAFVSLLVLAAALNAPVPGGGGASGSFDGGDRESGPDSDDDDESRHQRPVRRDESGSGEGPGTGPGTGDGDARATELPLSPMAWTLIGLVAGILLLLAGVPLLRDRLESYRTTEDAGDVVAVVDPEASAALDALPDGAARHVVAHYVHACETLAAAGLTRGPSETAREFAARVPPRDRDAFRDLTFLYDAARHGGPLPGPDPARRAAALAARVTTAGRAAPGPRDGEVSARG